MPIVDAADVLTPEGWTGPARVTVGRGVITSVERVASVATDRLLVPGFVDLQVNGIDDVDVAAADGSDWDRLDRLLLAQGVTTWCPTLVTMPLERYARPLARIAEAMTRQAEGRPTIAGVHLEGPWLAEGRCGAHDPVLLRDPDPAELDALVRVCPAALYKVDEAGSATFDHAGCLECGTCRIVAEGRTVASWRYPQPTMGVEYRYG